MNKEKSTLKSILKTIKKNLTNSSQEIPSIDFNRYTELNDMYGYVGFVDKEGGFYRVREIGSRNCGHGEWAYYFLDKYKKETGINPKLQLSENINILMENPLFEMVVLYEDISTEMNKNTPIDYDCIKSNLPEKQKEVVKALIDYQNKKSKTEENQKNIRNIR